MIFKVNPLFLGGLQFICSDRNKLRENLRNQAVKILKEIGHLMKENYYHGKGIFYKKPAQSSEFITIITSLIYMAAVVYGLYYKNV